MRRKSNISFGPGAASLILIVVILSLSVLGMLALMNARNDSRLNTRATAVVEAGYALNAAAERRLAALDEVVARCAELSEDDETFLTAVRGNLPEGMLLDEERVVSWSESDGLRFVECEVELMPLGQDERLRWRTHRLTANTEEVWN